MTLTNLLQMISAFFRRLFNKAIDIPGLTAPAAVLSQVLGKPKQRSAKAMRRAELREQLHRLDGGGKHYGSKRAFSNHKGSQQGKRSGRR